MNDVTVLSDNNISLNEFLALSKYKYLQIEVTKMWKFRTKPVSIIIGALRVTKINQVPRKSSLKEMHK